MPERSFITPDQLADETADNSTVKRSAAIYGAGENGIRLARALEERGISVPFFLTTFDSGTVAGREVRIFNPEEVRRSGCRVIVASCMWKEIADSLDAQGFTDYAISDPNIPESVTSEHLHRLVETVELFSGRDIRHGNREEIPDSESKLVLHDISAGPRLELPNTLWEGRAGHHDPQGLAALFQAHPADMVVLVQHRDMNPLFLGNCIRHTPAAAQPFILTDVPRRAKAFLLRERKAVYFILPKCASSTIMGLLQSMNGDRTAVHEYTNPDSGPEFIDPADPAYTDWFKFTFVRHPLKRIASLYNFHVPGMQHHILHHLPVQPGETRPSFRQLVNFVADCPDSIADPHFRSQHCFVTDTRGNSVLDFAGRVEHFREDWQVVAERLDLDAAPKKRNASRSKSTDYAGFYDAGLRAKILARYDGDIRLFYPDQA